MEPISRNISGHYALEKKAILALCSSHTGYSIADFARHLGASIPKVTRIIAEMVEEGYLAELGKTESSGGRRASVFGFNPGAGYFVGLHVESRTSPGMSCTWWTVSSSSWRKRRNLCVRCAGRSIPALEHLA